MSHANRGRAWEQRLELFHARYEAQGRAVVIRTPPPMRILRAARGGQFLAVYESEGPPDYVLLAKGRAVMAEAKESHAERWHFSKLHPHQAKRMDQWVEQGGISVVLFHHQPSSTAWVIPWPALAPLWHRWHKGHEAGRRAAPGTGS